jgi:hypothetical protein
MLRGRITTTMNKALRRLAFVVLLSTPALLGEAGHKGCEHNGGKAKGCSIPMPEPSAIAEFAVCTVGIGLAVFRFPRRPEP